MPVLSAAQLAYIRSVKSDNYPDRLDIYAPPAVSNGKRGDQALIAAGVSCRRWPAWRHHAPGILAKIPDIAGQRVDALVFFPDSTTGLTRGGELRSSSGERLKIAGLGRWQTSIAIAVEIVTP